MGIASARAARHVRLPGELVLQASDEGILWRKLDRVIGADHLLYSGRRLAQGNLARIVGKVVHGEEGSFHLRSGIALEDVDRQATTLRLDDRCAALLELVAKRHDCEIGRAHV